MTGQRLGCDVLIVGGGLVGTALAAALAEIELDIVLVEAHEPGRLEEAGFDGRATALAAGSRRILEQLGFWEALRGAAAPIRSIHIGEQGRFGAARIEADEEGVAALGYTVENRVLRKLFWQRLEQTPRFRCFAPARLAAFAASNEAVRAKVTASQASYELSAKLLIAADGARSSVRRALGIEAREDDYEQQAVVVNCSTEQPLRGRAFERFTTRGPLAVLPLRSGAAAVVWTLDSATAEQVAALDDEGFCASLQGAFGYRLGKILRVGRRDCFPLRRVRSDALSARRSVLIGSAAVNLHPVAGQGFNLALRDVATLAEVIADEVEAQGAGADIGAAAVLDRYREWRRQDQRNVAWFTHGLVHGFGLRWPGLGAARGLALVAFDLFPGAKALLARHTMGKAGRLPRLARGLPVA